MWVAILTTCDMILIYLLGESSDLVSLCQWSFACSVWSLWLRPYWRKFVQIWCVRRESWRNLFCTNLQKKRLQYIMELRDGVWVYGMRHAWCKTWRIILYQNGIKTRRKGQSRWTRYVKKWNQGGVGGNDGSREKRESTVVWLTMRMRTKVIHSNGSTEGIVAPCPFEFANP